MCQGGPAVVLQSAQPWIQVCDVPGRCAADGTPRRVSNQIETFGSDGSRTVRLFAAGALIQISGENGVDRLYRIIDNVQNAAAITKVIVVAVGNIVSNGDVA